MCITDIEILKQANWTSVQDTVVVSADGGSIDGGQWQMLKPHIISKGLMTSGNTVSMDNLSPRP